MLTTDLEDVVALAFLKPAADESGGTSRHLLHVEYERGLWITRVECLDDDKGSERPCAVWANDDGSERENECTFQQYASIGDLEEWLCGSIKFVPVPIVAGGYGDDWHAVPAAAL